jgi:YegS/Rv2252/BmrU family lipid kinase
MMAKRVKLIFNPIANLGRAWPVAAALRPIVHELGGADWSGTVYPTHATELARQAGEEGYELVVAMGGDGTVHEVVNGLMQLPPERRPRLGVVPIGSGNDFAYALGVSTNPETALRQALAGQPYKLDVGSVCDAHGDREFWINTIGIGFDTVVTIRSRKVPIVQGFAIYLAAVLQTIAFNYISFRLQVKTEQETWTDSYLMLVLCNGKREGGGFHVAPGASANDGRLDYIGVKTVSVPRMLATIPYFMKGTAEKLPYVRTGTFERMELTSDRPMYVHMDGEVYAGFSSTTQYLSVEILPGALEAVV